MPSGIYKRTDKNLKSIRRFNKTKTGIKRPPFTQDWKDKIGEKSKGRHPLKEFKKGNIKSDKAYSFPRGENHPNWKGGLSKNPYPKEFTYKLKLKIRTRDNFICCLCRKTEREELEDFNRVLCVNHIDFNKNNCSENNLNTLCVKCNTKICRERDYWTNYFNLEIDERIPKKML